MKRYKRIIVWLMLLFVFLIMGIHVWSHSLIVERNDVRNVMMNRMVNEIQIEYDSKKNPICAINRVYNDKIEDWKNEFGEGNIPKRVLYKDLEQERKNVNLQIKAETNQYIWNLYQDNRMEGFIIFEYSDNIYFKLLIIVDVIIMVSALTFLFFALFVYHKLLKPFIKFSEYPQRLSKGETTEKLPELKNKYFGAYIWGMNMLNDKLAEDKKQIQKLTVERQTFVSTVAHGIKTPISTIKLYANAIDTGLYQENGQINKKDAEIARKIEQNAEKIEQLVTEIIQASSLSLFTYEPDVSIFYLKEIEEYIQQEYTNRLLMKRIPLSIELQGNPLISSDKNGICRIFVQLLDNAIKYGDGTGIAVTLEKQEDGYYFSVKNKGELLPNSELPYVFNSFWRGSNAQNTEGNGIGLYEARKIARSLGGDIFIHNLENEVEVAVWILDI